VPPSSALVSDSDSGPDPLRDKVVHITGWLKTSSKIVYTFAVSASGVRVFDVQESDLKSAGYDWKPFADCMGYLTFKKVVRTVTCDAPVFAKGAESTPIVIDSAAHKVASSPVRVQAQAPAPVLAPTSGPSPAQAPAPASPLVLSVAAR
jgi:hypothetical protein